MSRIRCMLLIACALMFIAALGCRGKRTFLAHRVDTGSSCVNGVPAQVPTLHKVTVQWRKGSAVQGIITEGMIGDTESDKSGGVQQVGFKKTPSAGSEIGADAAVQITTHLCRLPIVYGIDTIGTPFGTDDASLEFFENGQIKKAEEKRDHQIDELISSVTEGAQDVVPLLESGRGGSNPYEFFPPLPSDAQIIEFLEIIPLQ